MAESKAPTGTQPLPANPELANLMERKEGLVTELARLDKMDPNKIAQSGGGHDLMEVKRRTQSDLAQIEKAIQELTK